YDMHGYLWEYVADTYTTDAHPEQAADSPSAQSLQIIRGGSWRDHYSLLTSSIRLPVPDHVASDAIGFRCVISEE
ncbi:MAG: SUMF1/EgtB/PvdO family nonheme iron enzyme, partial [Planctomycetaceae bacterium]|nr:SUMF1/EgtB/PvdO family nonheme iron enzyme [Planctomycetaceae bacterium]